MITDLRNKMLDNFQLIFIVEIKLDTQGRIYSQERLSWGYALVKITSDALR
jgi:hypothetical protein